MHLPRATGPWFVAQPVEKLAWRAALPGAFTFDQTAHALRIARGAGVSLADLFPAALSASWLVNNRATSRTLQTWLRPPARAHWEALLEALDGGPEAWHEKGNDARIEVEHTVRALCIDGHAVAAVSKVLAVLLPETVPLMDDAALWFLGGWVPQPSTADAPHAGPEWFLPMLDAFTRAALDMESPLIAVAREHHEAVLDASQVLDRLMWFESWGYRLSHAVPVPGARYWWVADGEREGVVLVEGTPPARASGDRIVLSELDDRSWAQRAREALASVNGP